MKKYGTKNHAETVIHTLEGLYPGADCALHFASPVQLLIATILSAQCTDARVNIVTQTLFQRYKTATDFAEISQEALEKEIHSTGFYRNKAKNIRACCQMLVAKYGGEVPTDMATLITLPGVGRKTANCVLGTGFGLAEGITVDTHVFRLARRIGLSTGNTPEKVEADLMKIVPQSEWIFISHGLVLHGRQVCPARKPKCDDCPISLCKYRNTAEKKRSK